MEHHVSFITKKTKGENPKREKRGKKEKLKNGKKERGKKKFVSPIFDFSSLFGFSHLI